MTQKALVTMELEDGTKLVFVAVAEFQREKEDIAPLEKVISKWNDDIIDPCPRWSFRGVTSGNVSIKIPLK